MKCPYCSTSETKVIDSRINQQGDIIRRRRECEKCAKRFTTHERLEIYMPMVIKKDGRREPFDQDKLKSGITKACQKRPVTTEQIDKTVADIEAKLVSMNLKEVPARTIGHLVMAALHNLDMVAYVRFASVYREFRDVEEFVAELRDWPQEIQDAPDQEKLDFD